LECSWGAAEEAAGADVEAEAVGAAVVEETTAAASADLAAVVLAAVGPQAVGRLLQQSKIRRTLE
jgi:hypothetical protein